VPLVRERIDTPDGDFLDLDISAAAKVPGDGARRPVVVVLHGLEGSARRPYALLAHQALREAGITAVGLNFRGCSGEPNRASRFYHSGETGDLRLVLEHARARFPGSPLGALGFSLGGNVLLKYLGEEGDAAHGRILAAATISVPFDLAAGAAALERGLMARLYSYYFMRSLSRKIAALRPRLDGLCNVDAAILARTLRAFDDALTAPLHGFADSADYYQRSSSAQFLPGIRVPTLLIHSEDDPFLPAKAVPWTAIRGNPFLTPAISRRGGHVAFIAAGSAPWRPVFWAEREAARFLAHQFTAGRAGGG
jgi:predicted alpha/beta-fold hydrolase